MHASPSACPPAKTPVLLFGEVLIDRFPDRDVLGGAPFNVACHLRAFGLQPRLVTSTGNDSQRWRLLGAMRRYGMDTAGVQCDCRHATGQVAVETTADGHRFDILPDQAYDYIDAVGAYAAGRGFGAQLVYFGTLAQRHPVSRRGLKALLGTTSARRLLDINLRQPWYSVDIVRHSLSLANIVKVNIEELALLARLLHLPVRRERAAAQALLDSYRLESLLVTCGADGAWMLERGGGETQVAGRRGVRVVDAVGAGDGFAAVFMLGRLSDWPLSMTLERANAFAAAICGLRGAIPEGPAFYAPFLQAWQLQSE